MLNKVELIGYVGKDPEMHTFPNGNKQVTFSFATSERWKDAQTGEKKEKTEWHNCVARRGLADTIARYVKKGSFLYLEGRIETRKWNKDGVDHYRTEVVLNGMKFMPSGANTQVQSDALGDTGPSSIDDDVPF